ncbi:MAG: diguanylate cyclase, partial [Rubrivivax sp.]
MPGSAPAVDHLTGAFARAEFDRRWAPALAQARAGGGACALLVIDLDHFKAINDAFGHQRGDAVLQETVRRIRQATRASDDLYRWGGDEFVLVLPATGAATAAERAQRVLDAVRATPVGEPPLTLSLSIGVAACPDDGDDARALFDCADARCYDAKRAGRGRVVARSSDADASAALAPLTRAVEREAAADAGQRFLQALWQQPRGVLRYGGPEGAGRSHALSGLARAARLQGFVVLELACSERLMGRPLAALQRALPAGQADGAGDLATLLAALPGGGADTPALVCVDDLEFLDAPTLQRLQQWLDAPGPVPRALACVLDERRLLPAALQAQPLQAGVALGPLSADGQRAWLRMLLRAEPPPALVDALRRHGQGLPGRVRRLLERWLAQGLLQRDGSGWVLQAEAVDALAAMAPPPLPPQANPGRLPPELSRFIGRDAELAALAEVLDSRRLVTLTGAGGTGKSRLALRAAARQAARLRHGAWFVDLAPVDDGSRVVAAVADALELRKTRGRPRLEALCAWAARRELLIVLDNCEHLLLPVAKLVQALLEAAPELRLLATSREPLALPGEQVWRVPSLLLPPAGAATGQADLGALGACESVALFVDRARQVQPGFVLDAGNAAAVAQICLRLDGIPLALELAASRLRALAPGQLAQRLDDRFELLVGGSRTALPRQQTLRATVDWSHALLSAPEQCLLRRLAVFSGGCTLEDAEAVCSDDDALPAPRVLGLLEALCDKSLVLVQHGEGAPRHLLLETIRLYALERLQAAGEQAELQRRHLHAMRALAERAEPGVRGPGQAQWLDRLQAERDNLRAAGRWAYLNDAPQALALASALWRFCDLRGLLVEGLEALRAALEAAPQAPGRALALARAAYMARNLGDFSDAEQLARQALQLAGDDAAAEAMARFVLGAAALEFNRPDEGRQQLQQALARFRAAGDDGMAGTTLVFLGFEAELRNDVDAARDWMLQGLEATRRCGDVRRICHALVRLGFVAIAAGNAREALARYEEALTLGRAIGDVAYIANGTYLLGRAALFVDDPLRARELLLQVLAPRDGAVAA